MKPLINQQQIHGSALIASMIVITLLAVLLGSYLTLLRNSNTMTARSQAWNQAMPIVEAGMEEALTHMNVHGGTNLTCDGWQASGNLYWVRRTFGSGSYLVTISNYIANASCTPVIESRGYAPIPTTIAKGLPAFQPYMFAAVGADTAVNVPTTIARGARINLAKNTATPGLFVRIGFEAQNTTGVLFDSYNSSDPLYSSNGVYVASKARDNCYVGTIDKGAGKMNIHDQAKIAGTVGTGAVGVLKVYSPASVGSFAYVNSGANGGKVQAGHLITGVNIAFPNVVVPAIGSPFTPGGGTHNGTNYAYKLFGGNFRTGSITLNSAKMIVTDDSRLDIDTLTIGNGGEIIILPGKTLTVYMAKSFVCSGTAKVNATGKPVQFQYKGLASNQSFQISGSAIICGMFYAPSATTQFQDNSDFSGSGMFYDIQVQHNFHYHYDESLGSTSGALFYVTRWDEMSATEVAKLPPGISL